MITKGGVSESLASLSIRARLIGMVGFISVLLIGIGVSGIIGMKAANDGLETVYKNRVVPLKDLKIISDMYSVNVVDTVQRVRNGYLSWADGRKNIDDAVKTVSERWKAYLGTSHVEEEKKVVSEIEALMKTADVSITKLKEILKREDIADLFEYVSNELYPAIDPVSDKFAKLVNVQLAAAKEVYDRAEARYDSYRTATAVSVVGGMFLSLFAAFWIIRGITRKLSHLTEGIGKIAKGDLTVTIASGNRDEISTIGRAINEMTLHLRTLIGEIKEVFVRLEKTGASVFEKTSELFNNARVQQSSVETTASALGQMNMSLKGVAESADLLSAASEEAASTIAEMSASISEVAQNMESVSFSVNETASSIEEMYASVKSISENIDVLSRTSDDTSSSVTEINSSLREIERLAVDSAQIADKVRQDASNIGIASVGKTIEGMRRIEELAEKSAEVIGALGRKSREIDSILTLIDDVTDETKLLSLNAAILAAQAGQYGKGFAVVADEIKVLAEETDSKTRAITQVVSGVQTETLTAVESIGSALESVKTGLALSRDAGEALQQILQSSVQASDMAKKIEGATITQAQGIKLITHAVMNVRDMVGEFVSAIEEQKKGMANIAKEAENMRDITRQVKSAAAEQASGGRQIKDTIERFSEQMIQIAQAVDEIKAGSDHMLGSIERIKNIADKNASSSAEIKSSLDDLTGQANQLKERIEIFSV